MGVFSRSWEVTKATLGVMKKDKEIFAFPVVAIIASAIFLVLFVILAIVVGIINTTAGVSVDILGIVLLFIMYLGLGFISTFFSACVVYTAGVRFKGGDATFGESISNSFKKIDKIFLWAILSATVSLIFRLLENAAKRAKGAGKIILSIFNSLLGLAWSISTIFVVQSIMYNNKGPFGAIKDSVITLKKTWGESLVRYIGLGMIQFIAVIVGLLVGVILMYIGFMINIIAGLIFLFLTVLYIVGTAIFFNIANQVFNTALFIYANTGKVPQGYSQEQMREVFKKEEKKTFGF
jgi:hypothetical protein